MSIFSKIISGEIPSHKIAEDENYFAFLDINPLKLGHTLVVTKLEEPYIFNLNDELLSGLHLFAKRVAKAVEKSVECERIGVAVIGLEVPHTHVHLVPINHVSDMNFSATRPKFSKEEFESIAEKIKKNFV